MTRRIGVMVLLAGALAPGCSEDEREGVFAIGTSHFDFGRVKGLDKSLKHEFTVINQTSRTVRISEVKKTCTCIEFSLGKRILEPGETTTVTVGLDATLFWGEKTSFAVLVFDDPKIEELYLAVRAFLEKEYRVIVRPARWTFPADHNLGATARRTFHAREIISGAIRDHALTKVRSLDENVQVVDVGAWKAVGKVLDGNAREAEIVLECHLRPEMESSFRIRLEFTHEFSGGASECGKLTAETMLSIHRM